MKQRLTNIWHAGMTAVAVSLIGGLFVLGLPQFYEASAIVTGSEEDAVLIHSADLLGGVLKEHKVDRNKLGGWQESWLGRPTDALNLLRQRLDVNSHDRRDLLEVSLNTRDPELSATLVNSIAEAYLERLKQLSITSEQRESLSQAVSDAEQMRLAFMTANPETQDFTASRHELQLELNRHANEKAHVGRQVTVLEDKLALLKEGEIRSVKGEAQLLHLITQRDNLGLQLGELSARYGSQHKKMKSLEARLSANEQMLKDETARVHARVIEDLATLAARLAEIEEQRKMIVGQQQALEEVFLELEQLDIAVKEAERRFRNGTAPAEGFRLSAAVPPDHAVGMGLLESVMLIFVSVFVLAMVLVSLRPILMANSN